MSALSVKRARGLTLIEMLVAVSVFAVLAVVAHLGLAALVRQDEGLSARAAEFEHLAQGMHLLQRDLLQALPGTRRDGLGGLRPALRIGSEGEAINLEFVRADGGGYLQGGVTRVRYRYQDGLLSRSIDKVLDGAPPQQTGPDIVVLDALEGLAIEVRQSNGRRLAVWPPPNSGGSVADRLPAAIVLTLQTEPWGELQRTLMVGG